MSIIERVADLLARDQATEGKPSLLREEFDSPEAGLVEQVIAESGERLETIRTSAAPVDMGALPRPQTAIKRPPNIATRKVTIDLEQLRRQNMVLPGDRRTPVAEAYRRIKQKILLNLSTPGPKTRANLVMVTSSVPGEGKSFCAINLALSIALEQDHTVLLVDGDVARPSLPHLLGFEGGKGLMDVLADRRVRLSDVLCDTNMGKLMLLPAGTAHPQATELMASSSMRVLLHELADPDPNRVIIFDSPPLMAASEASVLASQMGQVVVVVEAEKTSEGLLKIALGRLESANIVGLVLNKGAHAAQWDGYGEYGYDAT